MRIRNVDFGKGWGKTNKFGKGVELRQMMDTVQVWGICYVRQIYDSAWVTLECTWVIMGRFY